MLFSRKSAVLSSSLKQLVPTHGYPHGYPHGCTERDLAGGKPYGPRERDLAGGKPYGRETLRRETEGYLAEGDLAVSECHTISNCQSCLSYCI
jgi:hypothetical protein